MRSEHEEAKALMRAVRLAEKQTPELALFFAVPNGGHRDVRVARKMQAEGVRRGVPDYLLPVPRGGYSGLAIELKAKGGRATKDQRAWLEALRGHGWRAEICHGWGAAWDLLMDYVRADG